MAILLDDLFKELRAELKKGRITEAPLRGKGWHIDGLCNHDEGRVYVDPAPTIAEILMHELLHRRFPRWGEKRVDKTARRLLRSMNSRQAAWWARQYQRRKRTITTPVSAD
jgi:hypothetical protein